MCLVDFTDSHSFNFSSPTPTQIQRSQIVGVLKFSALYLYLYVSVFPELLALNANYPSFPPEI